MTEWIAFDTAWSMGRGVNGVLTTRVFPPSVNSEYGTGVPGNTSP